MSPWCCKKIYIYIWGRKIKKIPQTRRCVWPLWLCDRELTQRRCVTLFTSSVNSSLATSPTVSCIGYHHLVAPAWTNSEWWCHYVTLHVPFLVVAVPFSYSLCAYCWKARVSVSRINLSSGTRCLKWHLGHPYWVLISHHGQDYILVVWWPGPSHTGMHWLCMLLVRGILNADRGWCSQIPWAWYNEYIMCVEIKWRFQSFYGLVF